MKRVLNVAIVIVLLLSQRALAQESWRQKDRSPMVDSTFKFNPYRPVAMIAGTNILIWTFNRFVANEPWARVNMSTISNNMIKGFTWDSDGLETNMFSHP
ncbi:MAG: hypothetical protein ACRCX5_05385, partial [Bacteroidales bacterium]